MTSYKNTKGKIKRKSVKRRNNKRGGQDNHFRNTINKQTGLRYEHNQPNKSFKLRRLVSSLTGMYTIEGKIKNILNYIYTNNGNEINEDSRKFLLRINDDSIKINDNTRHLLDHLNSEYKNNFTLKLINLKVTDNHSNTGGGKTNTQTNTQTKKTKKTKKTKPTTQSKIDDYFNKENKENIFSTPKKATQERNSEVPPTIRHYYNENGESFKMLRPDGQPYTTADTGPYTIVPFTPVTPKKDATPPSIKHSPTGNTPVTEIYDDKTDTTTKILTEDGKIYTNADRAAGKQGYLNGVKFTPRNLFSNGGKKRNIHSNKRTKKRKKKTKKRSKSRNTIRH